MAERFGVVVAIGLTFFGLMLIAAQDIGVQFGGSQQDRIVLASESFGEVGGATSDIRTVNFGSFNIGEGRGEIQAYQADKVDLKNSLTSGNKVTFDYNATQPTSSAVSFEVLGKEGTGALYVKLNGKRIFEQQLVTSATETVNISRDDLKPGINTFEIGVNKGGLVSSTHYALEDLEVTVNDRKFNDHVNNFQLYDYELKDFMEANLTFNIPADSSVITEPLEIRVNGNQVFSRESVRSSQNVELSRSEAELHPGYNSIRFGTEADAQYSLENTQLTVRYIGTTRQSDRTLDFNLNSSDLNFVQRENTRQELSFDYQVLAGGESLEFQLGSFNTTTSPVNGQNQIEIPGDAFSEENTLEITGEGSYTLNNLKLVSRRIDD